MYLHGYFICIHLAVQCIQLNYAYDVSPWLLFMYCGLILARPVNIQYVFHIHSSCRIQVKLPDGRSTVLLLGATDTVGLLRDKIAEVCIVNIIPIHINSFSILSINMNVFFYIIYTCVKSPALQEGGIYCLFMHCRSHNLR